MNPLVRPVPCATFDWDLPRGLNGHEFRNVAATDMDTVAEEEVKGIARFADLWLAGGAEDVTAVRNQPTRASRWLVGEVAVRAAMAYVVVRRSRQVFVPQVASFRAERESTRC
jgi:hypothetical protein